MVKIFSFNEEEKKVSYDFDRNHVYALGWIENYEKRNKEKLPEMNEISVKIGKNHAGKDAFVMIACKINKINYACPIEFNQEYYKFIEEFKIMFNTIVKMKKEDGLII